MRGPGEFFGTRQAGLPDFRVANLVRDRALLELAKQEAARFANSPQTRRKAPRRSGHASGRGSKMPGSAGMGWSRLEDHATSEEGVNAGFSHRKGLDLEVHAGNLCAAVGLVIAGALAEFREADVAVLAEFKAGGDENAVDVHAGLALKLKQHGYGPGIVGAPAEHPTTAAQNSSGEDFDKA